MLEATHPRAALVVGVEEMPLAPFTGLALRLALVLIHVVVEVLALVADWHARPRLVSIRVHVVAIVVLLRDESRARRASVAPAVHMRIYLGHSAARRAVAVAVGVPLVVVLVLVEFETAAVTAEARTKPSAAAVPAHAVAVIGALLARRRAGPLRVNPGNRAGVKGYNDQTGHDDGEGEAGLVGSSPFRARRTWHGHHARHPRASGRRDHAARVELWPRRPERIVP